MNTNYKTILTLALLGFGLLAGCQSQAAKKALTERNENNAKRFAARAEFTRKPAKVALVKTPSIKGQTIEMASLNGGEYSFKMNPVFPSDGNPDEIKTIIQQDCRAVQKGVYRMKDDPSKTLPAMAMSCQIVLIDRATATAYYMKNFETEPDPEALTSKDAKSVYKTPDKEIKAFLESLPRQ